MRDTPHKHPGKFCSALSCFVLACHKKKKKIWKICCQVKGKLLSRAKTYKNSYLSDHKPNFGIYILTEEKLKVGWLGKGDEFMLHA